MRFRSVQAVLLDAWLADESAVTCDEAFERARRRLQDFTGIAPAEAPPGFQGELRGYQRAGLGWLHFLREFGFGGCLADDMGLGKTVQVLALLESRRDAEAERGPAAIPGGGAALAGVQLDRRGGPLHAAPAGARLHRRRPRRSIRPGRRPFADCDVVLTTYGTLRKDVAALREVEFDYLILDEAQAIKNADSQTAKAARLLRGRHRLALTGTPVENHLGELWSLLEFLNPGFLGASPALPPARRRSARVRLRKPRHARPRAAPPHPAPHQGGRRPGAAAEARADDLLRAAGQAAQAL